ncbi:uncharacterized protein LOC127283553 [Leptopilina boulardi]|uniref:uncharacterized protein LOC127283553 n=1 Tax=Leptopilina boulardi TaxID=63433 RepID=UPI0021F617E7|nr:uncharacterized protein LOC127283553 [Leptopilina boulardi]
MDFMFQEFQIGNDFIEEIVGNETVQLPIMLKGINIPLRESLKTFLEIPGVFNEIMNYIKQLQEESTISTNILQGDFWKTKYFEKFKNDIVFPLNIFFDNVEVGNPLERHKFTAIYASIACLPPRLKSKFHSFLFSSLINSENIPMCGNKNCFQMIIDELNHLNEKGILITVNNVVICVKFQLLLILSDNSELNGILGFNESNKKDYFCRICTVTSKESIEMEDEKKLRNKNDYEKDVQQGVRKNGIKEECVFNQVKGFHVMENITVDHMHDFFDGVCAYVMRGLLFTFIYEKQYFTLQTFNERIEKDFSSIGNYCNKPPKITPQHLLNALPLKMSSSKMLNLVRYFGVIVGDLISENDCHWELYTCLRQIFDILLSPRTIRSDAKILKNLIENHNKLYKKFYGKLKPKFHSLFHYPRFLLQYGPIVNLWGLRFESYYQPIKQISLSTSYNENLLKTIATKETLKMCETMHSIEFENDIKFGTINNSNKEKSYFDDCKKNDSCQYYNQVEIEGILYKIGAILILNIEKSETMFGDILNIIYLDNEIYFYLNVYEEITFDFHHHAYIIYQTGEKKLIKHKDLPKIDPAVLIIKKEKFVVTQYGL